MHDWYRVSLPLKCKSFLDKFSYDAKKLGKVFCLVDKDFYLFVKKFIGKHFLVENYVATFEEIVA
jgi:hypothetical protein